MFDVVIIGAGPAGLAAVAGIKGNKKVLIVDQGRNTQDRSHTDAKHLGFGVGGAGLFSDGKFSYYPAGTAAYELLNKNILQEAHEWVEEKMHAHNIECSRFKDIKFVSKDTTSRILEKKYPSFYASLEQRRSLMLDIADIKNKAQLLIHTLVDSVDKVDSMYVIITKDMKTGILSQWKTKKIILASGRFGTRDLKNIAKGSMKLPFKYLRIEFGVRVESPSDIGFLSRKENPDVKFIWRNKFGEVRTFCTCRDGEIWNIPYNNSLSALSGRSDGPKSGFSNFGLLVRISSCSDLGASILKGVVNNDAIRKQEAIVQSLHDFLGRREEDFDEFDVITNRPWFPKNKFKKGSIRKLIGDKCSELLTVAIKDLLKQSPDLDSRDVMLVFPSIEGVGEYLETDKNLKVKGEQIWVAGDSSGVFRGLIPAFVSGYYTGHESSNEFNVGISSEKQRGIAIQ